MLECGTQCSVESVFFSSEESRVGAYALSRVANRPRVKGKRMDIKRSLMPTGDSVNDGSREERTAKPTPWMQGEPRGRPFQKKVYPLPLLLESFIREMGFTECSCVDVVALEFSSNKSSTSLWSVITCVVEKSTCIPCSNPEWFFCNLYFYFFHVSTAEWDWVRVQRATHPFSESSRQWSTFLHAINCDVDIAKHSQIKYDSRISASWYGKRKCVTSHGRNLNLTCYSL